jgi:hypothetical protein
VPLPVLLFRHSSPHTDISSVSLPRHSSVISVLCFAVIENATSDTRTPVVFFNHSLNYAGYRSRYLEERPLVSTVGMHLRTAIEVGAETAVVGSRRRCREHVYRRSLPVGFSAAQRRLTVGCDTLNNGHTDRTGGFLEASHRSRNRDTAGWMRPLCSGVESSVSVRTARHGSEWPPLGL